TFSDGVKQIGEGAFADSAVSTITLPVSIETIGEYAFGGSELTTVYYLGTEEQWGAITIDDDNDDLTNATIHYGDTPQLPAPTINVTYTYLNADVQVSITGSEETDRIQVMLSALYSDGDTYDICWDYIDGNSGEISFLGTLFAYGDNTYRISATPMIQQIGSDGTTEWIEGETANYDITLPAAEKPSTVPNELQFSSKEGYSGEISVTVEGAEAIAYLSFFEGRGGGVPNTYTLGDTVYLEASNCEFGIYEVEFWGRFNGVWYWIDSDSVIIQPFGSLEIPAVSLNGRSLALHSMPTVYLSDSMVLKATCDGADKINYDIVKVEGEFDIGKVDFGENNTYSNYSMYDQNEYDYDTLVQSSVNGQSATFDLSNLHLTTGDYRLRVRSYKDNTGWKNGQHVVWLHFEEEPVLTKILTLPNSLKEIEEYAFEGVDAEIINVPAGCRVIGEYAFANCPNLYYVVIRSGIQSLAGSAFEGCPHVIVRTNSNLVKLCCELNGIPVEWID
ncbi:MAG: leucine-rich repeat protein, partial [Clostridia bacterium]|nr:leucine-rich repeat protein [Clostridia bacterium]